MGQVETVREVSSRAPDGAGACLGFSPHTQGSTLQHVAPMKATCGPGRRRFTPETRCAPAQVSPFFFFSVLYFPVWQPIFTQFHLTLSEQTVSLPHCLCRKTNTCTVNNEGDGTLSNCLISVFPQYFEYNIYSLYGNPPPGHRTSFCIYIYFCFVFQLVWNKRGKKWWVLLRQWQGNDELLYHQLCCHRQVVSGKNLLSHVYFLLSLCCVCSCCLGSTYFLQLVCSYSSLMYLHGRR